MSESLQPKDPKRKFANVTSQSESINPKIPRESFQTKDQKLKNPSVEKADDIQAIAGESRGLVKQLGIEAERLQMKVSVDTKSLSEYRTKKAKNS